MNNIQIERVDVTLNPLILDHIQYLKQHLDDVLTNSNQTIIENLIEQTKSLLEQAKDDLKTYQERYVVFQQLNKSWFDAWNQYKNAPDAIDLISSIDHLTNYFTAYSYLFLSLSRINEGRIGDYRADLERIVSGFLFLSEIVDIFTGFFSVSELKQIYGGARNAISVSTRNVTEYFENGFELSSLVTQLRAYSSLIVLKLEENIKNTESTLKTEVALENKVDNSFSRPWWEQIDGTFANDSVYDEAMRLGREYRKSTIPGSTDPLDV